MPRPCRPPRGNAGRAVLIGTIVAVPNYGAGDILEIAPPAGDTLLFPFTRAIVPEVDLAGGKVIVVPPVETDRAGKARGHDDVGGERFHPLS